MKSKVVRELATREKDQDRLLGSDLVTRQDGRIRLHIIIHKTCHGVPIQCRCRVILIPITCHGGNAANVQSYASNAIQPRVGRTKEANS
ncbi:hypothetical protein [Oryza sativa Japonica Group]|uniref:Uncharacterized protein n=1 Tax=Oryza sativa subsp. japonica TaxID=39947 RepID=Q656I7_ORYSJ|nr:hypothetical protein [Oryza sativa Japonica Group]